MDNEEMDPAAPRRPGDTSAAIAANRRRGLLRKAEQLRAEGFYVLTPEELEAWRAEGGPVSSVGSDAAGVQRHEFGPEDFGCEGARSDLVTVDANGERHEFADGPTWDAGGHAHTYGMPCPAAGCRWPVTP